MPKVVLASGAFDLLHYGHVFFLKEAKKAGGADARLVVVVARDKTVESLKGSKPVIPEEQRRALVESLKPVDEAILGYEYPSFDRVIRNVKPDIVAVGYDQEKVEEALRAALGGSGLNVAVVRIPKFTGQELASSSKIKEKMLRSRRSKPSPLPRRRP